jgi:hypothetical protein
MQENYFDGSSEYYRTVISMDLDLIGMERRGMERLRNEELHNLYFSPNIIRMIRSRRVNELGGACSTNGGDEKFAQNFGCKS